MLLLLLLQVFESSNQSSYNESCKDLLPRKRRRSRIPDKPNYSLNLWSIMKNCIGKELSKIPMPVSEPQGCCCHAEAADLRVLVQCRAFGLLLQVVLQVLQQPLSRTQSMWQTQPGVWLPLM